jgi:hypothetical protein
MKKLLVLALVALTASGATAAFYEGGVLGLYFSDTAFIQENTNINTTPAPFNAYIVLLQSPTSTIGAYEVGITISDLSVFVLNATGPNGWTNFGSNTNHLCGYQVALPVDANDSVVLGTLQMLYAGAGVVTIDFGPANPSSFALPNGPYDPAGGGIADGALPDDLYHCSIVSGGVAGTVATLNGEGVATEQTTWTSVRNLFE